MDHIIATDSGLKGMELPPSKGNRKEETMHKLSMRLMVVLLVFAGFALASSVVAQSGAAAPQAGAATPQATPPPAAAPAANVPMQSFRSDAGHFTAVFPGTPTQSSEVINLKNGETTTLYEFAAESDNGNTSYIVMYNDYQPDVVGTDPQALLQRTRDGAVAGKTMLSDVVINLNGVPGRAYTAEDSDGWHYEVHEFLAGARFYQLIVTTAKGHTASQIDAFMSSFHIL